MTRPLPKQKYSCIQLIATGLLNCFTMLAILAIFKSQTLYGEIIYLDSLDLSNATEGWSDTKARLSIDGNPLTVDGIVYNRGIGTHSEGIIALSLHGSASRFRAIVGVDDEVADYAPSNRSKVRFRLADEGGSVLFDTTLDVHSDPRTAEIDVDISGMQTLYLLTGTSDDTFEYDHGNWLNARIVHAGNAPYTTALQQAPNPVIAAPIEGGMPRINGASLVAVGVAKPIVYTIPASGLNPKHYMASNLPSGVNLDEATGRLSGSISQEGRYPITVTVTNALGAQSKLITLDASENLALTPPMGWNSYDSYGDSVTEAEVLANAEYVRDNLLPYGWDTIVVDYRWYDTTPIFNGGGENDNPLIMDQFGRLQPAVNRFPSAANGQGFAPLAQQIHDMGLRFGIHIMRGIPQDAVQNMSHQAMAGSSYTIGDAHNPNSNCRWLPHEMFGVRSTDTETYFGTCYSCSVLTPSDPATPSQLQAGADWYKSIVDQYASWGVDFIKADDMSSGGGGNERPPYSQGEVDHLKNAIDQSGRSIVLSLSPGETPIAAAQHLNEKVNMWRMSDDFWDRWSDVIHIFNLAKRWEGLGSQGHWPDADMLPFGYLGPRAPVGGQSRMTSFTQIEQVTIMSLWAVLPSPYMLGANLADSRTTNDDFTRSILMNPELIDIHQDSLGSRGQSSSLGLLDIWQKPLANGDTAIALFNLTEIPSLWRDLSFAELGLTGHFNVRDVWQRQPVITDDDGFAVEIPAHGVGLYRLSPL